MRNTLLAAVAALSLIGGAAIAQTDDTGQTTTGGTDTSTTGNEGTNTQPTTSEPAAPATTTSTMTTLPGGTGGTIGQSVTDSSGTVVGVVQDIQLNTDNTIQGIIINDTTGSFVVPPDRLMRNADGSLMLNATAEEIRNFPVFGGDGVGDSKGGPNESGRDDNGGEEGGDTGNGGDGSSN